jgi:hypothetical protein
MFEQILKKITDELKDSQDTDELKDSQDTDELKDSQDAGKNEEHPFPTDIWEYLEKFHKKEMLNLPTQNDRIELLNRKPERVKVWDYFFPLNKVYTEEVYTEALDKLKQKKQDCINNYENNREKKLAKIKELRIKIQKENAELREKINPNNECEIEIQNIRKDIQKMQNELKLNRDYDDLLTNEEEIDGEKDIEFLHNAASAELDRTLKGYPLKAGHLRNQVVK